MSKTLITVGLLAAAVMPVAAAPARPNVLIVITDDQGYGDLGCHGNPILKTPNLDAFAKESVQLTHFHVSPVCSPTRSSLLTGRYNYRTGVIDTFVGRSMMHADEVTLAEMLRDAGYRTGLFGKWHLGDNYPLRPQDQGFQEVLTLRGGGLAQPSDPPGGGSYSDPILFHNGKMKKCAGYVTDVLTDAAIDFVARKTDEPFFAYVAYNCPHSPYQVQDADWKPYKGIDLGPDTFPKVGSAWSTKKLNQEEIGKAYGMIANIDMNFARLLGKVPENTLVVFLTDNGPGGVRWNAGLRNRKGTTYDGGIRVPFYVRWPGQLAAGRKVDTPSAHIDITPTVLEACRVVPPKGVAFDGRSVVPLLKGEKVDWPERHLFFQWHRGDLPEMGRAFAARGPRYKLVQAAGVQVGKFEPKEELFDIPNDPFEEKDLAAEKPDVVRDLHESYEAWFKDVKATRNFQGPRIHLGSDKENPTVLTRQDWRGPNAGWTAESIGHWDVTVERAGTYRITVDFEPSKEQRTVTVQLGDRKQGTELPAGKTRVVFERLTLTKGEGKLEALVEGEKRAGPTFVEVERVGD
ncbi:MAG TPA: arylsulfatase [Gemmataceae bacterium]|nr:arylsulfatase [Gemmataceae bacterium]